ncbi:hypothetical protein CHLRE_16g694202v5 [Chlamydomonas reinhardtii]|uniref:MYND-type domain-containing protein n=1 Tax=Chlamydomonas reinhardtii TaxID=3055 RepID=A0A2K3CSB4_CHLRE|nr:uncharacterized protein CHLRE_16g694202v5 [Chlamydomonas reinhardtii]PNW71186.1 hypothetical protein CHLRE_16g694202v5 [Chlamydomonas reinhardtii]
MAASQLWYVPYHPDLVCLAPCDTTDPVPGPGCMFVGLPDKLQTQQPQRRKDDTAWKHPKVTAFVTCFGDLPKQQPRVVRCACGKSPCGLRGLSEGAGVTAEDFIPADWHSKFELPTGAEHVGPESRRVQALDAYLQCTGQAERELPAPEGREAPEEADIKATAEVMLTDFFKGRICHACHMPSTRMMRCGSCREARYCSRDCQRKHWSAEHKASCAGRKEQEKAKKEEAAAVKTEAKEEEA